MADDVRGDAGAEEIPHGWAVHAWGSPDMPPIVLLHGFMQDGESWADTAEGLAKDFYVVAPTMTVDREEDATLDRLALVAYGAAQQAMLHTGRRKVVMLGYSMGGRIALAFARRFAGVLDALVLESAGLGPETEDEREGFRKRNEELSARLRSEESLESFVDFWEAQPMFDSQRGIEDGLRRRQRIRRLACDKMQLAWAVERAGAQTMPSAGEIRAMLESLDVPVLYIAGKRDRKYCDIAATLEGSNVEVRYLNSGHNTHLEAPVEFADCVMGYLEEERIG